MSSDEPTMADRLALVGGADDVFVSASPTEPGHVFGGLLIGQALRAGQLTVPDLDGVRPVHVLHASFVTAGRGNEVVHYDVERTRDGGSFTTRRVVARQQHGVVLVMTADFHADEPGLDYETPPTPGIPAPESLAPGRYASRWFDARDVPVDAVAGRLPHGRRAWYHPNAPVPDDPLLQLQCLAYLSDHGPTRAARQPHVDLADDARRQSVSLDHSVWFHRPVDVNDWLLSELIPVATGRGRGLSLGTIRTAEGSLLATVAQAVLLRQRPA
ncbi:MAG: acyl-CoA thioesterase [Desertimonas sp.]